MENYTVQENWHEPFQTRWFTTQAGLVLYGADVTHQCPQTMNVG